MGKSLVIVESPTKARTIKRYLGKDFEVEATMGHIKDLPKSVLGVEIDNGFTATYRIKTDKKDVVKRLKNLAAKAEHIYLAPDPDREGEAIAWHVAEELRKPDVPLERITFHEITKRAIEEALAHPTQLNRGLYDAQMARRSMDRLVGYTMSPLLWKKVKRGLSGGRVQSVALRLICMRQEDIEAFVSQEYWTIDAHLLTGDAQELSARVVDPKEIPDEGQAREIVRRIQAAESITINAIRKKVRTRQPQPPFITSTLQQSASTGLRFSAKKTMILAQQLYEGLPIKGEEITGLITYMRTDSPVVSQEALREVRAFIPAHFGPDYLPARPKQYKAKKTAQEAHEAIRPTAVTNTPQSLKPYLSREQLALYELIWNRFVASQMAPAVYDQTTVEIGAGGVGLRTTGSVLKFDGFLKAYRGQEEHTQQEEKDTLLPQGLAVGQPLTLRELDTKQHFTQPPPRYTEATLIKELEDKGIGRPSTYAPTISTIQERGYVRLESRAFVPTELGRDVNFLLVKHYPHILDIGFTARMEEILDTVEEGKTSYRSAMQTFYDIYGSEHDRAEEEMENLRAIQRPSGIACEVCGREMLIKLGKNGHFLGCAGYPECTNTLEFTRDESGNIQPKQVAPPELSDEICEKCGERMVIRHGRYGPFLACSKYPACKNTTPLEKPVPTDKTCDKCGAPMVSRRGRYGPFLACSNYPECKNIMPYPLGLACPLPGCEGEILQQRSKRGKLYYKCSQKDCPFISWTRPVEKPCPLCGAAFLVGKGNELSCPNPACDYEEHGA